MSMVIESTCLCTQLLEESLMTVLLAVSLLCCPRFLPGFPSRSVRSQTNSDTNIPTHSFLTLVPSIRTDPSSCT